MNNQIDKDYPPKVGDYVKPDHWITGGEHLQSGTDYKDSDFPGCQFYLKTGYIVGITQIAVNITLTGKPRFVQGAWKTRCQIEFVGDGQPSEFTRGFVIGQNWA